MTPALAGRAPAEPGWQTQNIGRVEITSRQCRTGEHTQNRNFGCVIRFEQHRVSIYTPSVGICFFKTKVNVVICLHSVLAL